MCFHFLRPILGIVGAYVMAAESGHHLANFSTWGFNIYRTAHGLQLRVLSIAHEEELTVLDYAQ